MRLNAEQQAEKNRAKLVELALKVGISDEYADIPKEMRRLCDSLGDKIADFSIGSAKPNPYSLGAMAKFLATLYLAGNGDLRLKSIVENLDAEYDKDNETLLADGEIVIPLYGTNVITPFFMTAGNVEVLPNENGIRLKIKSAESCFFEPSEDELQRFALSVICQEMFFLIANSLASFSLESTEGIGSWRVVKTDTFIRCVIDEIAKGHIAACADCGKPIYVKRLNASPFCTRGHYNRYRDKAKLRFDKGWTFKQIHEAFPALSEDLILDWFQLRDAIETVPYHG